MIIWDESVIIIWSGRITLFILSVTKSIWISYNTLKSELEYNIIIRRTSKILEDHNRKLFYILKKSKLSNNLVNIKSNYDFSYLFLFWLILSNYDFFPEWKIDADQIRNVRQEYTLEILIWSYMMILWLFL